MRLLIVATALSLAACVADPPRPPEERTKVVEVPTPVPVPCFTDDERPIQKPPTPIDIDHATADQLAAALAADEENIRAYSAQVDALFLVCMARLGKPVPETQPKETPK